MSRSCDVLIVGAGMIGSACAWALAKSADFNGRVIVVERDPGLETASTSHTNSCIREQFSTPLNIAISQYALGYIRRFAEEVEDEDAPEIAFQPFGYMFLADADGAPALRAAHESRAAHGVAARLMSADEVAAAHPDISTDDIALATWNPGREGYFDGAAMHPWWRRKARERGVEFVTGEVAALRREGDRITAATLASGEEIATGAVVNAAGPRAARLAAMAGIRLPVEPRKRFTWMFDCAETLSTELPLIIDPSGIHVSPRGSGYLAGSAPRSDDPVEADDFAMDHTLFEDRIWPVIAARVPKFERIRVVCQWVGHYAFNPLDRNAIIGPHDDVRNFIFANGFSGHGLQQSPAVGRAVAEWIALGRFASIDFAPFAFARMSGPGARMESAVI